MSNGASAPERVQVPVERLFKIVKALIESGLADAVVERFKDQFVLVQLDQAEIFKAFVEAEVAQSVTASGRESVDSARAMNTAAARLREVMPREFGHCRPG
jgi:hypothetical protein